MNYLALIKSLIQPNTNFSLVQSKEDGTKQGENSNDSSIFVGVLSQYDTNSDQQISNEEYQQILKDIEELELAQEEGKSVDSSNPFAQFISKVFTKDAFSKEMESINDFLSANGMENTQIENIQEMGIDNFFALADKNGDSVINAAELENFFANGVSQNVTDASSELPAEDVEKEYNHKDYSSYKFDQFLKDIGKNTENVNVSDLMAEKNNTIANLDNQIKNLNGELNNLINNSLSEESELKTEYTKSKDALSKKDKELSDKTKSIDELDNKQFEIDSSIANIEGQLSQISTDNDDEEINAKNRNLISNLQIQLQNLKQEKQNIEKQKVEAEKEKIQLEKEKANLQKEVDACLNNIALQEPEIASQISGIKEKITQAEAAKVEAEKIYTNKIDAAQEESIKNSKKQGETQGQRENNSELVNQLLDIVCSEEMFMKWNGQAWSCSGFVGDCLQQIASELPFMESKSCQGLQKLGQQNNAWLDVSNLSGNEAKEYIKENVKPGMVFLSNKDGQLHVGFVTKVYEDGSWDTMEANTVNTVTGHNQAVFSHHRTYAEMAGTIQGFTDIEKVIEAYRI